jgi:hypothetical protein
MWRLLFGPSEGQHIPLESTGLLLILYYPQGFGIIAFCDSKNYTIAQNLTYESTYFQTSVDLVEDENSEGYNSQNPVYSWIRITAQYLPANYTKVPGDYENSENLTAIEKTCDVYGGIVEYDVVLQNQAIRLQHDDWSKDRFLQETYEDT